MSLDMMGMIPAQARTERVMASTVAGAAAGAASAAIRPPGRGW
ncbi:hypothetical protein [Rhodanobacter geophilus]|uniref:Uncharacterized protein n=1 Tax=Rhodanobacter geophilus TaxID=3162488 RepID=A0ABV3QNZ9_9GAMM